MPSTPVSAGFAAVFQSHASAAGVMPFAEFMRLALYHPEVGYYRREKIRVGYVSGTDFFTASTSGPVFGALVATACASLLRGRNPQDFTFVELGAEPGTGGVLAGVPHSFGFVTTVRLGEPLALAGPCVVFSNELFDAQPFHRCIFRNGVWRELGVALHYGALQMVELPGVAPVAQLPATAPEGYVIDAPLAAVALLEEIAAQPWTGLFVACDYGKSWQEITEACPSGTARAYHRHTQTNDLLARPGEQDLTCHICWDWLTAALAKSAFADIQLDSQESFFIRHATGYIAQASKDNAAGFSRQKQSLHQLLHPAHLGQKFQVLHAWRTTLPHDLPH